MIRVDEAFAQRIEAAVRAAEAGSDAEIVVVIAPRSGQYRDLGYLVATGITWLVFGVSLAVPTELHPWALWAELIVVWTAAVWLLGGKAIAPLIPRERASRQVADAARVELHREMVHATPARTGVLVYLSLLERRVELLPDLGIDGLVPQAELSRAREALSARDADAFVAGLGVLGELLTRRVPATPHGPGLELSDAPRIRS